MFKQDKPKNYLHELDEWVYDKVITPLEAAFQDSQKFKSDEPFDLATEEVKKAIRAKVLESYHNGQDAKRPSATRR
jgi:hypothetical protein